MTRLIRRRHCNRAPGAKVLLVEWSKVAGFKILVYQFHAHVRSADIGRQPDEIRQNDGASAIFGRKADEGVASSCQSGFPNDFVISAGRNEPTKRCISPQDIG